MITTIAPRTIVLLLLSFPAYQTGARNDGPRIVHTAVETLAAGEDLVVEE